MKIRVATAAWKLRRVRSDGDFFAHLYDFVNQAYDDGAKVLLLPELFSLELLHLEPNLKEVDVPQYLAQWWDAISDWLLRISNSSGLTIVGGSHFMPEGRRILNVCPTATPEGLLVANPKNRLTSYERDPWDILAGESLAQQPDDRFGVLVCYDSEFPEAARAHAENGASVLLVPAYTETKRGYQRVKWCCQARAIQNQMFVVPSSLVGSLGREPVVSAEGAASIYTPSIEPFEESAVLASTEYNEEGIAVADLDFALLSQARKEGDVRNWEDRTPLTWSVREMPVPRAKKDAS